MSNKQSLYEHDRSLQLPYIAFDTKPQLDRVLDLYRSSLRQHALHEMQSLATDKAAQRDILQIIEHWMRQLERKAEQNYSVNGMKYAEFKTLKSTVEPHNASLPVQIEDKARELDSLRYKVGKIRREAPADYASLVSRLANHKTNDAEVQLESALSTMAVPETSRSWISDDIVAAAREQIQPDEEMSVSARDDSVQVEYLIEHIPAQISKMDRLIQVSKDLETAF